MSTTPMNTREQRAEAFERLRQDLARIRDVLTDEGLHALPGLLDHSIKTLTEIEHSDLAIAEDEVAQDHLLNVQKVSPRIVG